jgi:hypothetical protein
MPSILSRLVVAGMLISISASAVFGQDPTMALKLEWSAVSKGRTEFEVSDAALLPSTLALAAEQSGCSYKDDIKNAPVRFMRPEGTPSCYRVLLRNHWLASDIRCFERAEAKAPRTSVSRATGRRWHHGKAGLDHVGKGSQRLSSRNWI